MTMLASWIGIDPHGPTSAYIVGDSRFSWNLGSINKYFDYGKKVFASNLYPEIFGYAGDVLFPSILLSQIIEMIDMDILFTNKFTCEKKNNTVYEKLRLAFSKYPDVLGTTNVIQILHISRDTLFESYPRFYCFLMSWNKFTGWKVEKKNIPDRSDILFILGSGKDEFMSNYSRYQSGHNKDTSRNVFHCFIDTLFNIKEMSCGGPPQLVGIYRKPESSAKNFGIVYQNKRYFLGAEIPKASCPNKVEWRNEFFELCDGKTKKVRVTAVKQPDLLRRK